MINILKALAYARVSTAEQAEADLSIPAQLREVKQYAIENNIEIVDEYIDEGLSAYNDELKRLSFNSMIERAKFDPEISLILVHEFSRFSRNKYHSSSVKNELRKHGVNVITTSSPYDTNTVAGLWRESIDETIAQTTSMQIAEHTMKGMKENAFKRDPESGYCFKNGGRAPYGYSLKRVPAGKDSKGQIKHKLLWEINAETSLILKRIVVDFRIGEGLSYKGIRDRLNSLKIPGPQGGPWGTSTIREMLVENRLEQYTGIYYWNKEDHNTPGKRYKDKSEWIKVENAHPAILTNEEVETAMAITKSRQPRTPASRSFNSKWLLTGLNLENEAFFTCKLCGKNIIGIQGRNSNYGYYKCSNNKYKGEAGCTNKERINRFIIEKKLLNIIESKFSTPGAIEALVNELNSRLNSDIHEYENKHKALLFDLAATEKEIELTFSAFAKGLDPDLCNERLDKYKVKRNEIINLIKELEDNKPTPVKIDSSIAIELFKNLKEIYEHGTNEQKKNLFKTYIRSMIFNPTLNLVQVTLYPDYIIEKAKSGDLSPLCISSGVGRGI